MRGTHKKYEKVFASACAHVIMSLFLPNLFQERRQSDGDEKKEKESNKKKIALNALRFSETP